MTTLMYWNAETDITSLTVYKVIWTVIREEGFFFQAEARLQDMRWQDV